VSAEGQELDLHVRSHRLHAQRFGSPTAPLLLGMHGVSLNMKSYDFLGERIGGGDLQLVAVDLRGRGRSETTAPGTYGWENHALDMAAVADELRYERFSLIGQSMGGSVAMKAAELYPERLDAVILVDIAGRVDRGAGELIGAAMSSIGDSYPSMGEYLAAVRAQGLIDEWNEYWERCYRYGAEERDGRVRARVSADALAEDRAYAAAQGGLSVYERWRHLTMPTLLLRAARELQPGVGHVVPADDRAAFARDVPQAIVVDVDANHLTINVHPDTPAAVADFLAGVRTG
jgi:pimeloyl-ACP methyl ester carboxylesterase